MADKQVCTFFIFCSTLVHLVGRFEFGCQCQVQCTLLADLGLIVDSGDSKILPVYNTKKPVAVMQQANDNLLG